jgi:CO/xanthine dehydrogenase FAD-binding subunit
VTRVGSRYIRARTLDEVLSILAEMGDRASVLAGGTDLILGIRAGLLAPECLVDVTHVEELRGIRYANGGPQGGLTVGAATTVHELETSPLLVGGYRLLAEAAGTLASVQIRNRATVGGNLCHAAPSADCAPPLLALDAEVELAGRQGRQRMPLEGFFVGPGRTRLSADRVLVSLHLPYPGDHCGGCYIKHSLRRAMDCAFVGVAALVCMDGERMTRARIALGAVAPTPMRAHGAEALLQGSPDLTSEVLAAAGRAAAAEARPIDDIRAGAWYRCRMVEVQTRRALERAVSAANARESLSVGASGALG